MFYELRQYEIVPGKMDEWMTFMEGEIIPFFQPKCTDLISGANVQRIVPGPLSVLQ